MDVSLTQSTIASEPGASTGDVSTLPGRSDPRSPMSMGPLGASTLSMRAKAARKRQANTHHNSNFRAGYVAVQEDLLHRTGIRGRKRYFLYCTLTILTIFALLNLATTVWLMYILGMTHLGMNDLEITSQAGRDFVRFLAKANIVTMSVNKAPIGGRYQSDLTLEAEGGPLQLEKRKAKGPPSSIVLNDGNITMTTDQFCFTSKSKKGDWVSNSLDYIGFSRDIVNLEVKSLEIHGVHGFRDLYLESIDTVTIEGNKGVNIISEEDINVKTASLHMDSDSVKFATQRGLLVTGLPQTTASIAVNPQLVTFKLCVCANGKLFQVKVTSPYVTCDVGRQELRKICRVKKK